MKELFISQFSLLQMRKVPCTRFTHHPAAFHQIMKSATAFPCFTVPMTQKMQKLIRFFRFGASV